MVCTESILRTFFKVLDDRQFHRVKRLYFQALDRYKRDGGQSRLPSPYDFHVCLFQRAECEIDDNELHRFACHVFAETEMITMRDYVGDTTSETYIRARRDVSNWRIKVLKRVARVILCERLSSAPSNGIKVTCVLDSHSHIWI